MRNAFGVAQAGEVGFGAESEPGFAERVQSRDQIAIVWSPEGDMVVASPLSGSFGSAASVDVARFPSGTDAAASVSLRRTREFGLPALSRSTYCLTAIDDHSERTKILALDGEKLAFDDAILLEWLINAERQMLHGTDNHPVFETALEDTACGVARLPNGQVSMTEVPRDRVSNLGFKLKNFIREPATSYVGLCIETPLRSIARYFLSQTTAGANTRHHGRRNEVTAFISMNMSGYSFGLWSSAAGLFTENAFLAPEDVSRNARNARRQLPEGGADPKVDEDRSINEYVRKAFDQLLHHMSPEKLEQLRLSGYTQIVYAAEPRLLEPIKAAGAEITERTGLEFVAIGIAVEEAVATGLILGSHSFGAGTVAGAELVQPVNLARDILVLADAEESERRRNEEIRTQKRRNRAVLTVLAPPAIAAAFLLAVVASLVVAYFFTSIRESQADSRTRELKPALDRRKAYEANLKWYQEFIAEVSRLRRQQPVGIGLLQQLNSNYPFAIDPSFYVSDLKLTQQGDIEMKGLARNKDAVATFLKSLEFAGGEQSGTRLFSNMAYEVQEVAPPAQTSGAANLPTMTGATLTAKAAAPGVVQWKMTGDYAPVVEFQPKPSPSPGAKPAPAAAPAKPAG